MHLNQYKKPLSIFVVVLLVLTAVGISLSIKKGAAYETGQASIDDILTVNSHRKAGDIPIVVNSNSPFNALISTPAAVYYEKSTAHKKPLLIVNGGDSEELKPIIDFMKNYGLPPVVYLGDEKDVRTYPFDVETAIDGNSIKDVSLKVARYFWKSSDAVLIIREDEEGYNLGILATSIASYLNIPIIVTEELDEAVAETLRSFNVKYSLLCGNIGGFGKILKLKNVEDIEDLTLRVIRDRLGSSISYITITNPLDAYKPNTLKTVDYHFEGRITNSDAAAYPGMAPINPADSPIHYFTIPSDYRYAEIELDAKLDISKEELGDASGARLYVYVGVDGDNDGVLNGDSPKDKVQYMGSTLSYENLGYNPLNPLYAKCQYGWLHTELPLFNDVGKHAVQLLARLPTTPGYASTYTVDITVKKLDSPVYPVMHDISSLAPYLTAAHRGVVLAKPDYSIYHQPPTGCNICGDPEVYTDNVGYINNQSIAVKGDLNKLLAKIAGMNANKPSDLTRLSRYYSERPGSIHVGILADANMVPYYYFKSKSHSSIPSDIFYSDIDMKPDNYTDIDGGLFTFEIPVGRITGWDTGDVSALIARTIFYNDIIDNIKGPQNGIDLPQWKDSAMSTVGTNDPVGLALTTAAKLKMAWERGGFDVNSDHNFDASRRQRADKYYESSNFIYYAAHGNYYWYVPPLFEGNNMRPSSPRPSPLPSLGEGGAFDVAHVKYMSFGPSVVIGTSCTTGRIDGLQPYNTLSQAFLHAGVNAFIGGTRSVWGADYPTPNTESGEEFSQLLTLYTYAHLTGYLYDKHGSLIKEKAGDATIGTALMLAKNDYLASQGSDNSGYSDDIITEYILYGDPAFNPYEPNHEGRGEYIA
jgi:hypothetical protein